MTTRVGVEPWRKPNPMSYAETGEGFTQRGSDDAPLRIIIVGDEEEIISQCVNERCCWNCFERFPAPLGVTNLAGWRDWGNPTEEGYANRRALIAAKRCPVCTAPSAPTMILQQLGVT
jgi:hypothetical protein